MHISLHTNLVHIPGFCLTSDLIHLYTRLHEIAIDKVCTLDNCFRNRPYPGFWSLITVYLTLMNVADSWNNSPHADKVYIVPAVQQGVHVY